MVRMVKSLARMAPSSTSSHVTGVGTVAPGSGRIDQAAAMLAPTRFMLWSTNTLPVRLRTSHSMVTRSGSTLRMRAPSAPTKARVSSYENAGWMGT